METSLKTGFAQVFSCCLKNLSCPNFGGAATPLAPPGHYAYVPEVLRGSLVEWYERVQNINWIFYNFVKKFFTQRCPSLP